MIELKNGDRRFLQTAYFPVLEKPVKYRTPENWETWKETNKYKAVITEKGELLNIVSDRYKLIKNEELINELMELLDKTDQKCYIDYSHSFINHKRMRLQFTFPELFLTDEEQDKQGKNTPLSLFIHNSYDSSEGVRGMWGAIRGICTNGMIFGTVKSQIYARHMKNADLKIHNFKESMEEVMKSLPDIQQRINLLEQTKFTEEDKKFVEQKFPQKFIKEMGIDINKERTRYEMINLLTFWVSHYVNQQRRFHYQQQISKQFEL